MSTKNAGSKIETELRGLLSGYLAELGRTISGIESMDLDVGNLAPEERMGAEGTKIDSLKSLLTECKDLEVVLTQSLSGKCNRIAYAALNDGTELRQLFVLPTTYRVIGHVGIKKIGEVELIHDASPIAEALLGQKKGSQITVRKTYSLENTLQM